MKAIAIATFITAVVFATATGTVSAASGLAAIRYSNCTALHKRYPHGVGKWGARDHTSGTPVTTFKRSNILYRQNSGLDRDKDGVACEKR
jgi:hypothetical protein